MVKKRIIPIQLVKGRRLVKSHQFENFRDVGDPFSISKIYTAQDADELFLLRVGSKEESDDAYFFDLIKRISNNCFIPLCAGGWIYSETQINKLFQNGVDKILFNSTFFSNNKLVRETISKYGSQSVVVGIDVKLIGSSYVIFANHGRLKTNINLKEYINAINKFNIGEIYVQNIDYDGTMSGYDNKLIKLVSSMTNIPVIAGAGAGGYPDMKSAFDHGASAVAAGSLFNFGDNKPNSAKSFLANYGFKFRRK